MGDGRHAALRWLGHIDGDLEPAVDHRQLHAARRRRLSACADTTTCRARATSARCRILLRLSKSRRPEIRGEVRKGWGVKLPTSKGLDNHEMIDAIHEGKLKAMYLNGEDMITSDSNANYVGDGAFEARFLRRAGHLLQRDVRVCRCRPARIARAWKRTAHSPTPSGASSGSTRPSSHSATASLIGGSSSDIANRLGADWNYKHPSRDHGRGCVADADVCGRDLRAAGGIQDAAMAGGGRWHRSAAALHEGVPVPRWQGQALSASNWQPSRQSRPAMSTTCT